MTYEPKSKNYTLRRGKTLKKSPSHEISYVKHAVSSSSKTHGGESLRNSTSFVSVKKNNSYKIREESYTYNIWWTRIFLNYLRPTGIIKKTISFHRHSFFSKTSSNFLSVNFANKLFTYSESNVQNLSLLFPRSHIA